MPTASVNCVHPGLKAILTHEAASHIPDLAERQIFLRLVSALPDCQGTLMGLEATSAGTQRRAKRAPSAYNLFMKQCASSEAKGGQGRGFKACAVEWRVTRPQKK